MGKKSRKAKAKTSDFQKVKLKVGKKRPLPSNVTDVSFKSQAIYIPEQLKNVSVNEKAAGDGGTEYKQNVPELLSQVGHFNQNCRGDALTSLRNYFTNNKHLIQQYLPKIIEKVPRTIADDDQNVRKSSIAFFKMLFSCLSVQEITPFYDIILSHLYCAMSHIYDDVQKDSLQIVDLCIEYFPQLLSHKNRNSLLQHFIGLISTKQTKSVASVKGAKRESGTTRILSMKLSTKESSITWRNRILKRLHDLLTTEETVKKSEKSESFLKYLDGNFPPGDASYDGEDGVRLKWDSSQIQDVLTHFESQKMLLPSFSLRSNPMNALTTFNTAEDQTSSPWGLITTLFPLLFDCWHEATSDESRGIGAETLTTMDFVLKIVNTLQKSYIQLSDEKNLAVGKVRATYMDDFERYFFAGFPFSEVSKRQQNAKKRKLDAGNVKTNTSNIQDINLSICQLITSLASEENLMKDSQILSTVATYLSMTLISPDGSRELGSKALNQSITTTRQLLKIAVDEATRENLLRPMLLNYQNPGLKVEEKSRILQFFLDLYSDDKEEAISSNAVMTEWLCSLPELLIGMLSDKGRFVKSEKNMGTLSSCLLCLDGKVASLYHLVLSCMRLGCIRQNPQFLDSMKEKCPTILEVLKNTKFCGALKEVDDTKKMTQCQDCSQFQARIFELLVFHSPEMSEKEITVLSQICHKVQIDADNVCYAAQILLFRLEKMKTVDRFAVTMKFLFSVLIGISKEDLFTLQPTTTPTQSSNSIIKIADCSKPEFERHVKVVEKLCLILPSIEHMSILVHKLLCDKILVQYNVLPMKAAYAILKAGEMLLKLDKIEENQRIVLMKSLGSLGASILLHCHDNNNPCAVATVSQMMKESVTSAFKCNKNVMKSCLQSLGNTEYQKIETWKCTCSVLKNLASDTNLHENLVQCQNEINQLLQVIKDQGDDVTSTPLFEMTQLRVSLLIG